MKFNMKSKKIALVFALIAILAVSVPGTLTYIVARSETVVNTFVPFQSLLGDVVISKNVEHPLGIDYKIPEDLDFTFEVELGSYYANYDLDTSQGMMTADENGVLKDVRIKPGADFYINGVDEDTQVTVREILTDGSGNALHPGFAVKDGQDVQTTTVSAAPAAIAFTNVYTPTPADSNIQVLLTKKLTGRTWHEGDAFRFRFDVYNSETKAWDAVSDEAVAITTADAEHTIDIGALLPDVYSSVGTYVYRIVEETGTIEDMRYDTVPRYFYVTVSDEEMDGALEISNIRTEGNCTTAYDAVANAYTVSAVFNNIYDEPELNTEDHFAYIVGYPMDYRTGEPTDDKSLWPVRPQGNITRAEAATIFFRMLTDESRSRYWSRTNNYPDVNENNWFNNAVSTLTAAGVLSGRTDGTFDPNGYITRAELATIASRFFKANYNGPDFFPDIKGHWAQNYINSAASIGLIFGYPDGTFGPNEYITRAETVAIVNRTLGRAPHKDHLHDDMIKWPDNMDTSQWYYADMQEATNSHNYEMRGSGDGRYEEWIEILPVRDWAKLEIGWSDGSDGNGSGEVMAEE